MRKKGFISLAICLLFSSLVCSCGNWGTAKPTTKIEVTVGYHLYSYDASTATAGTEDLKTTTIKCGNRYKLTYEVEIASGINSYLDGYSYTLTVKMGDYENSDNKNHIQNQSISAGGASFKNDGEGKYEATGQVFQDLKINLVDTYFIVGVDSLKDLTNQPVQLSFQVKKDSTPYTDIFSINGGGQNTYSLDFVPVKGDLDFSASNIQELVGASYERYDHLITYPKNCESITCDLYKEEAHSTKYGTKSLGKNDYPSGVVNFGSIAKEFVGDAKFDELINDAEGFTGYFVFTAFGGDNYNDSSLSITYDFVRG